LGGVIFLRTNFFGVGNNHLVEIFNIVVKTNIGGRKGEKIWGEKYPGCKNPPLFLFFSSKKGTLLDY